MKTAPWAAANITGGAVLVAADGTDAAVSKVNSLAISGAGKLDLNDNDLVVAYAGPSPIADVRGRGLMTGVELVDPATGAAATDLARDVRDELRERGVLIGTTRREKNVLKIRPPLCVTADETRLIVTRLDEVLAT